MDIRAGDLFDTMAALDHAVEEWPQIDPPVVIGPAVLPFHDLGDRRFEQLAHWWAEALDGNAAARMHGPSGVTDFGIDVLARQSNGRYWAYQCKCVKTFKTADLTAAVEEFFRHDVADVERFTIFVACEGADTGLEPELRRLQSIHPDVTLQALYQGNLSNKLQRHPEKVSATFGKDWGRVFCGSGTATTALAPLRVRVGDADARRLGVHAAISVDGQDGDLPPYVPRDVDNRLYQLLAKASQAGGFVLLLGGSCVGKTRTLFEALRLQMADWWLLHPYGASGIDLPELLETLPDHTVVWLDELQRYLDGPLRLTAATVRRLLDAGVVVVGTLWPQEFDARMASPNLNGEAQADNRSLLDLAETLVVLADLSDGELARASDLANADLRLGIALQSGEAGMTQTLAAGPDLQRRWEQVENPYAAALITAAVDARRLGVQAPITAEYLAAAVPGYLTRRQQAEAPADWLGQSLAYATVMIRGAASALIPDSGGMMGNTAGYLVADYLLQRGYETRRAAPLPDSAWLALATYCHNPQDLRRLGYSAHTRWRLHHAKRLLGKLAAMGDEDAARTLARILAPESPVHAAQVLAPFSETSYIAGERTSFLANVGDVQGLQAEANRGNLVATCQLIEMTAATDMAQLRPAASGGDLLVNAWLTDHDGDDNHLHQLRQRAEACDRLARGRLADILAERGRLAEAIDLLTVAADGGDRLAADHTADVLVRHGQTNQLQERANEDDPAAEAAIEEPAVRGAHIACRIAGSLADQGHHALAISIMQAYASAFVEMTDEYLIDLLVTCDRIDLLRERAVTGEWSSNRRLADLAAEAGDLSQLRALEGEGNWFATDKLAELMIAAGRTDEAIEYLTPHSDAGNVFATGRLLDLLSETGREQALRDRAEADPWHASGTWAQHLANTGRLNEAIEWLRGQRGPGEELAASQLADLLVDQGRMDEALQILRQFTAGYGDGPAVNRLVELLYQHARAGDLRTEVNAGASGAMERLLVLLQRNGDVDTSAIENIRRHGVTAMWPGDGSKP